MTKHDSSYAAAMQKLESPPPPPPHTHTPTLPPPTHPPTYSPTHPPTRQVVEVVARHGEGAANEGGAPEAHQHAAAGPQLKHRLIFCHLH